MAGTLSDGDTRSYLFSLQWLRIPYGIVHCHRKAFDYGHYPVSEGMMMNDRVLVAEMITYIEKNLIEPISAEDVAAVSGYSLNRFRQRVFNVTCDTPSGKRDSRRWPNCRCRPQIRL